MQQHPCTTCSAPCWTTRWTRCSAHLSQSLSATLPVHDCVLHTTPHILILGLDSEIISQSFFFCVCELVLLVILYLQTSWNLKLLKPRPSCVSDSVFLCAGPQNGLCNLFTYYLDVLICRSGWTYVHSPLMGVGLWPSQRPSCCYTTTETSCILWG